MAKTKWRKGFFLHPNKGQDWKCGIFIGRSKDEVVWNPELSSSLEPVVLIAAVPARA